LRPEFEAVSEQPQGDPLDELERRWESEQSPQLTLHLAEEYRRHGRLASALDVLRKGLARHPEHMGAQVALGRYLLEAEQPAPAVETLQKVVERDPTHLVANKLLVHAALAIGDPRRARDRLDLYATLSSGDGDIEQLEARVTAALAAEDGVDGPAGASAPALEEEGEIEARETSAAETVPSDEPFPEVWRRLDLSRYRQALAAEGLFALAETVEPASGEATAESGKEATVTLGRLYLEQGHREEAATEFRAVLARDGEDREALAGLASATADAGPLTTADLVAPDELASIDVIEGRRALVLNRYLERLRGRADGRS
jgi:predicted Zn-dependent protease